MKRVYLLIVLLLGSCMTIGKPPSVLVDSDCAAPCWNGIKVGLTTKDEMLSILGNLPIVDQDIATLSAWGIYDGGVNFYLYPNGFYKHNVVVESRFIKDIVANIGFCGNPGVTFGDIVEITGEPNNIIILGSPSGGHFVTAINEDVGIQFSYDTADIPKDLRAEITPEIPIKCVIYFAPEFYDEMLEAGYLSAGHLNGEQTLKAMRLWVGYGDLGVYMP